MMKKAILLIIFAYVWLNLPTLHDGLFHVYDNVQVTRIQAMYSELQSGQFPVRYIDSFGHGGGYLLFKYYSPLLYYLGAFVMYLGFSAIKAVKLIYLLMTAVGATGCFMWLRSQTKGGWPATLGTLAFITAPYVTHDLFHRGSMTEAGALMLMPWALWAYGKLKQNPCPKNMGVAALIYGALILTHTLTGVMTGGLLSLYLIVKAPSWRVSLRYGLAIVLALGVAAFSLVPATLEKQTIQYENNSLLMRGYIDHPVTLAAQLINQGEGEEKSAYLGITLMMGYIIILVLSVSSPKFRDQHGGHAAFTLIAATVALYLIDPSSAWIWERVIYLRYFQFPFRLLTVVTVALTLGLAIIADYYRKAKVIVVALTMLLLVPLVFTRSYYQPLGYQYGTTYTVDDPCRTTTWADEYLSKWTNQCLLSPLPSLVSTLSGEVSVSDIEVRQNGRVISYKTKGVGEVQVAKYYASEWVASDESGAKLSVSPHTEHGLIKVSIEKNEAQVTLRMVPSVYSKWGDLISLISLLICAVLLRVKRSPQ